MNQPIPTLDEEITRLTIRVTADECILWEDELKLYMKPKPKWIPLILWGKLVSLVLYQTKRKIK